MSTWIVFVVVCIALVVSCAKEQKEIAIREKGLDTALVKEIAKDVSERPVKIKVDSVLSN